MIGETYNRLTVKATAESIANGKSFSVAALFSCECGQEKILAYSRVKSGQIKSCGCYRVDFGKNKTWAPNLKHGQSHNPTYRSWYAMHQRCENPNNIGYENYGGRGIIVCARWNSFQNFFADMGTRPEGKTLDRKDNEKNYELSNCKWSTHAEQQNNRRNNRKVKKL